MSTLEFATRLTTLEAAYESMRTRGQGLEKLIEKLTGDLESSRNEVDQLKGLLDESRGEIQVLKRDQGSSRTTVGESYNELRLLQSRIEEQEPRSRHAGSSENKVRKPLKVNPPHFDGKDESFQTWLTDYKNLRAQAWFSIRVRGICNHPDWIFFVRFSAGQ